MESKRNMCGNVLAVCLVIIAVNAYNSPSVKKPCLLEPVNADRPGSSSGPVTQTPSGTIRGSWMTSRRGRPFQAYRGVSYAEPPVGSLRFQPPVPIERYSREVDASEEGPACPLVAPPDYYVDEDCLRLNVYTPTNNSSARLPVIFFIHPGGFYSMTGRSDVAGPHYLLDRDLILVTINYRLAALGFLSTGDALAPGNNGMKDQVAALKWVQRNIASFGGDPQQVTIAGVSAGSISVMMHMLSPMAKGLFHRGIAISASPIGKEPTPEHQYDFAVKQAQLLNCPTTDSKVIVDCLMKKPWRDLGNSFPKFFEYGYDPVSLWKPVVERDFGQERYLTEDPVTAVAAGRMHPVPLIIGQTRDEFAGLAFNILNNASLLQRFNSNWQDSARISFELPSKNLAAAARRLRKEYLQDRPLVKDDFSKQQLGMLYGDSIVGFNTYRMANMMSRYSPHPVWYYELAYVGNNSHTVDPDVGTPTAAAHHDDMLYLFSLPYRFPAIPADDSADSRMVDRMTALWYTFAKHGTPEPRPDTPELSTMRWLAMDPNSRQYLVVDRDFSLRSRLKEDRMRIWDELYPLWV